MSKVLSAAAQAISADLQAAIVLDEGNTGSAESNIYYEHGAKAGYEKETIDGVKKFDRTFMAGVMDATSNLGLRALAANPELERVDVSVQGAKGEEFNVTYSPMKTGVIAGKDGAEDKPWTSYGSLRGSHKTVASGKGGDLGAAMDLAAAAAEAALTKK